MTEIIDLTTSDYVSTNRVMQTKDANRMVVKFARGYWTLFYNDYREQSIAQIKDGDKEAKPFHGRTDNVPVYNIYRQNRKIGFALPRVAHTEKKQKYLYIPKTTKLNQRIKISRPYYIFDVDDEYNIKHMARLLFRQ